MPRIQATRIAAQAVSNWNSAAEFLIWIPSCCWEPPKYSPTIAPIIASTLATSVRALLLGQRSMFTMSNANFDPVRGLPFYVLLGIFSGIVAIGFTKLLYWVEDQFDRLPIDDLWHPAIGALGLGIIGFFVPRVLGVGYDTISDILNNTLALKILILIAVFKALALVISLGPASAPTATMTDRVASVAEPLGTATTSPARPSCSPGPCCASITAAPVRSCCRAPSTTAIAAEPSR